MLRIAGCGPLIVATLITRGMSTRQATPTTTTRSTLIAARPIALIQVIKTYAAGTWNQILTQGVEFPAGRLNNSDMIREAFSLEVSS